MAFNKSYIDKFKDPDGDDDAALELIKQKKLSRKQKAEAAKAT
jgi:hypothetical protein